MLLTFTHHIANDVDAARARLTDAIGTALESAAARLDVTADAAAIVSIDDGVRLEGGLPALTGSELHMTDFEGLTEVRVEIPWSVADNGTSKLWAAVRFAGVLADELALVA